MIKKIDFLYIYISYNIYMDNDKIKIKGEKGTKGTKDKNKKNVYSGKHVRKQMEMQIKRNKK